MVGGNLILTYQNIIKAGNMWETLYLTNLFPPLIKVQRVPPSHSSHINFQVNRITRFRDIDVGSWPSPKESNLAT